VYLLEDSVDIPATHSSHRPKQDLKERILKGIAEISAAPIVFRRNKFDLGFY
jgi:hypothetical protein